MEPEIIVQEAPAPRWPYNGQWSTWIDNEGMTWDQYIANDAAWNLHVKISISPERDSQRYSFIQASDNRARCAVEFRRYFPTETATEAALSNVPAVIAALEALS